MVKGLRMGTGQKNATVLTSSGVVIPFVRDRVGLIISCPPVNRVTLSMEGTAVSGLGIVLNPGQAPVVLLSKWHGDITTKQFTGIADVGSQVITWIEIIAPGISNLIHGV